MILPYVFQKRISCAHSDSDEIDRNEWVTKVANYKTSNYFCPKNIFFNTAGLVTNLENAVTRVAKS